MALQSVIVQRLGQQVLTLQTGVRFPVTEVTTMVFSLKMADSEIPVPKSPFCSIFPSRFQSIPFCALLAFVPFAYIFYLARNSCPIFEVIALASWPNLPLSDSIPTSYLHALFCSIQLQPLDFEFLNTFYRVMKWCSKYITGKYLLLSN